MWGSDASGVTVATTRPETMFGDVCLVTHPEDERFASLKGRMVSIPISGLAIPIELSTAVERDFGTGMLKVTPAHDPNDYEAGLRHGLERVEVIGRDGTPCRDSTATRRGSASSRCSRPMASSSKSSRIGTPSGTATGATPSSSRGCPISGS